MQISAGTYVVSRAVPAEDHSGVVAAQFGYSRRVSPLRMFAPALALLIIGCARGDAPKSTATPPAQLPAGKKTKGTDTDALRRAPAATATATVGKPKCNCTPGDPTCNC